MTATTIGWILGRTGSRIVGGKLTQTQVFRDLADLYRGHVLGVLDEGTKILEILDRIDLPLEQWLLVKVHLSDLGPVTPRTTHTEEKN